MRKIALIFVLTIVLAPALAVAQGFPIAAPGTEGLRVIVNQPGDVIATYRGNSATYSNDLYFGLSMNTTEFFVFNNHESPVGSQVNLGSFPVGTELFFRLHVRNTGYDFYTGPADRNPDGKPHARVQGAWQTDETLVSFEDLFNGPFVYNDLSFSFTNTDTAVVVCDAGGPYYVLPTGLCQFDGSGSFSTNSTIIAYEWDFGDGHTASSSTPVHMYTVVGIYTVELCVTDDLGHTSCCTTMADASIAVDATSWGCIKNLYR